MNYNELEWHRRDWWAHRRPNQFADYFASLLGAPPGAAWVPSPLPLRSDAFSSWWEASRRRFAHRYDSEERAARALWTHLSVAQRAELAAYRAFLVRARDGAVWAVFSAPMSAKMRLVEAPPRYWRWPLGVELCVTFTSATTDRFREVFQLSLPEMDMLLGAKALLEAAPELLYDVAGVTTTFLCRRRSWWEWWRGSKLRPGEVEHVIGEKLNVPRLLEAAEGPGRGAAARRRTLRGAAVARGAASGGGGARVE